MINTTAEFYQGNKGQLFRLLRTPDSVIGHIIFVAPLFEEANKTRHMVTRAAIDAYHLGYQSIIFDHFASGDSAGELISATLTCWQQDVLKQINDIKAKSDKPIILSVQLSAALLLNDEMISLVDSLQLWQPEFNGKRFVQQFKRLSLAANLNTTKSDVSQEHVKQQALTVAGYTMTSQLLDDLAKQSIKNLSSINTSCHWFEWLALNAELPNSRANQQEQFKNISKASNNTFNCVSDSKFWQMTELVLSEQLLVLLKDCLYQRKVESSAIPQKGISDD